MLSCCQRDKGDPGLCYPRVRGVGMLLGLGYLIAGQMGMLLGCVTLC